VFNGAEELVPICTVSGGNCSSELSGEAMPSWARDGWQYFRARIEGEYLRFFWSPDRKTWRIQAKSGQSVELGAPLDGGDDTSALETDPNDSSRIFRWNVTRQYDANGGANPGCGVNPTPVNLVVYRYRSDGGIAHLSDIYDTPPIASASTASLGAYAHHTHLTYASRPDIGFSYRRGWKVTEALRLTGVDVSSATFGPTGAREQVRRYRLSYDAKYHVSLLTSVQLEGKCGLSPAASSSSTTNPTESASGLLPASTGCPLFPATTFGYQHVAPFDTSGSQSRADIAGWEGFDERVLTMTNSPAHSLDETLTDLFDINADGLPDVLVTAPYLYGGNDAVYVNGAGGAAATFGASQCVQVSGVPNEDTNIIRLDNANVSAMDIDGDGIINLVHMPQKKDYSVYSPLAGPCGTSGASGWVWTGQTVTTASNQSPKIDFTNHSKATRVMDVNGDGLVDVVFSSGTDYQTFFSLGRYPKGFSQYGNAVWSTTVGTSLPDDVQISNDPVTSCLPWSATPALLSDSDVKIGDMNGDGLPDIVRVRAGDVRYWPGRGNGFWGTGEPSKCPSGTFGQNMHIAMSTSPQFGVVDSTESMLLDDVNGDGLDDLVKVEFETIYVWLNVDGTSWTQPHIIKNAPARVPTMDRMRLVDINGSGTRDILYGDGSSYKFMDLNGGSRPWVLTQIANGLGKTTEIQYKTSTELMLADAAAGKRWQSVAPMPVEVVTQVLEKAHLDALGLPAGTYTSQYSYRDPVYDGRQREFRGFRTATSRAVGDTNSPTSNTTTKYLLGDCENDENQTTDPCTAAGAWQDNPREALKGLPAVSDTYDDSGNYVSTIHRTYRLRKLYTGLDGREVRVAFQSSSDQYLYDDGPFTAAASTPTAPDVELETTLGTVTQEKPPATQQKYPTLTVRASNGTAHLVASAVVDAFGNETDAVDSGNSGSDETITRHTTPGRPTCSAGPEPSGWLWRTVESYVTGSACTARRDDTLTQYDCAGNAIQVNAVLVGTLPLDRPSTGAPAPPLASTDSTIPISSMTYDSAGMLTNVRGANGRCRAFTADNAFDSLTVLEQAFVGSPDQTNGPNKGCGKTALSTIAEYDRGLGLVTKVTGLHGEVSTVTYDSFGRLSSMSKPDPDNVGQASSAASIQYEYALTTDPVATPYSLVMASVQVGSTASDPTYRVLQTTIDGFGRPVMTAEQADTTHGDTAPFIVEGVKIYDAKGAVERVYQPQFTQQSQPMTTAPTGGTVVRQRYDAFGRAVERFGLDGALNQRNIFHALSTDRWDAADLEVGGQHEGTPATEVRDGHGRVTTVIERIHVGGGIERRETQTNYLPTGEPSVVQRVRDNTSSASVVRWVEYDSLGRMVLNVDPDTSTGFVSPPTCSTTPYSPPATLKAWRYAYDDNGDLVGTSDARGCGANYHYDAGGRIVAEDFSPCLSTQQAYSSPNLSTGDGTEAFYQYDARPADVSAAPANPPAVNDVGCKVNDAFLLGRLVAVSDRGSKTVGSFDGRGRTICTERQVASPAGPSNTLGNRYAPHWYARTAAYDGADRAVITSTGADVPEVMVQLKSNTGSPQYGSRVTMTYSPGRGTLYSVGSDYGAVVQSVARDADGLMNQIVYGDVASTTTALAYDLRRRLSSVQTYRGPPALWTLSPPAYSPAPSPSATPPTSFQRLLEDVDYKFDAVDNPIEISDWRDPTEWPAGAKPVSRKIQYDDLYRTTSVSYTYTGGADPWTSPFAAENVRGPLPDPRLARPSPHVAFASRIQSQTFQYDWLGNTSSTADDASGFYDRSLGTITNGTATLGPHQLRTASISTGSRSGALATLYDAAGNLTGMSVARGGSCLPNGAKCSQLFLYDWDEVGRLVRAQRWDLSSVGPPNVVPPQPSNLELDYVYDASDQRVLKEAIDRTGTTSGPPLFTAYIFNSLDLRRAAAIDGDYDRSGATEVPYLSAGGVRLARIEYAEETLPAAGGNPLHAFLEMPDHLGSTSIVVDRATSELVERGTYMAYGQAESDYRPARWGSFREDYRFTGKEEDVEVGLQYFGKRFYSPTLNRWVSADPATVHLFAADENAYAYVHGSIFRTTDPSGLCEANECLGDASGSGSGAAATNDSPAPGTTPQGSAGGAPEPGANSGPGGAADSSAGTALGQASAGGGLAATPAPPAAPPPVHAQPAPAPPPPADTTPVHGKAWVEQQWQAGQAGMAKGAMETAESLASLAVKSSPLGGVVGRVDFGSSQIQPPHSSDPLQDSILQDNFDTGHTALSVGILAASLGAGPIAETTELTSAAEATTVENGGSQFIFRTGSQTDAALTDASGVSFRSTVSSSADKAQVFRPGDKIWAVDKSKLPPGSVVNDNVPFGHVSVTATPGEIRAATVPGGPGNPLHDMMKHIAAAFYRLTK
jgi:RHS repeat-associated protein